MSNTPPQPPGSGPPFGQNQPPGGPEPTGRSTSMYSVIGVAIGLLLFVLPGVVFGVVFGLLDATIGPSAVPILLALALAIAVPVGLFVLLDRKLKDGTVEQQALRNATRIIFFVGAGTYAIGGLLVGACIALLAGAY